MNRNSQDIGRWKSVWCIQMIDHCAAGIGTQKGARVRRNECTVEADGKGRSWKGRVEILNTKKKGSGSIRKKHDPLGPRNRTHGRESATIQDLSPNSVLFTLVYEYSTCTDLHSSLCFSDSERKSHRYPRRTPSGLRSLRPMEAQNTETGACAPSHFLGPIWAY